MGIRIVEVGRLELKGADARFKQKGTLEASDRNMSGLKRLMVRASPAPEVHLFADFVFEGEIFRVYQHSTLINYKDFLAKVEFSGLDNFRAFVRHVTAALPAHDLASREFAEKNAPPERFVSREEMASYEAALVAGVTLPGVEGGDERSEGSPSQARRVRAPRPEPSGARSGGLGGKAPIDEVEREFLKHSAALAQEARQERPRTGAMVAATLTFLGAAIILLSALGYVKARQVDEISPKYFPVLVLGGVVGMGLFSAGLYYLKKNQDLG